MTGTVQHELERLLEALHEDAVVCDADGRIVYANPAARERLGAPESEVIGSPVGELGPRIDGTEDAELRRARAAAQTAKLNFDKLFEDAPAAIAIVRGEEMRYELSNAFNQRLAGGRQLVGRTVREALPAFEADGVIAVIRNVYQTGEPYFAHEYPVTIPASADRPERRGFMNGVAQPLHGSGGAIEGVMVFAYEVTDLVTSRERVREAEEHLRLAIESAKLGTWDLDMKAMKFRCDPRYRQLCGLSPDAELTPEILVAAIHPEDRATTIEAGERSTDSTGSGDYAAEFRTVGIEDGVERWLAVRGRTFFDERGKPTRMMGIGAEITQERQALERQRFLAEASTLLSSSLEYQDMLPRVASLAVPRLADWCAIQLARDDHDAELDAVVHADPLKAEAARDLARRLRDDDTTPLGVARVMASRKPQLVAHLGDAALGDIARDPQHLRLFEELRPRSALLVPLWVRDRAIGVLSLYRGDSGRTYGDGDVASAVELAERAATSIENARLYAQARRAIGVRDQFLSIASHELRTPLTSLTLQLASFSRLAKTGALQTLPAAKLEARISRMERQTTRLAGLIDELLDVSRISSGRLAIACVPTDLVEVVGEVVERLADEASRAGAPLVVQAPASLMGNWDPNRLDQVVTNLVGNAIKYAPGQPIDIEVSRHGERAVIGVRDRGVGISEGDQQRIFGRFERAAPAAMAGLGLGLWIATRIAEVHGGAIRVESRPGQGASFFVELPLSPPDPCADQPGASP